MSSLFCCGSTIPYRPQRLSHESKFSSFTDWAAFPRESSLATNQTAGETNTTNLGDLQATFVVQLVRQVNYGPLESKRYFARVEGQDEAFVEVTENDLIEANFQKLNSYKNYKCDTHNKFFELNVYQKDPINKHHWRINVARPGSTIDL